MLVSWRSLHHCGLSCSSQSYRQLWQCWVFSREIFLTSIPYLAVQALRRERMTTFDSHMNRVQQMFQNQSRLRQDNANAPSTNSIMHVLSNNAQNPQDPLTIFNGLKYDEDSANNITAPVSHSQNIHHHCILHLQGHHTRILISYLATKQKIWEESRALVYFIIFSKISKLVDGSLLWLWWLSGLSQLLQSASRVNKEQSKVLWRVSQPPD